MLPIPDLEMARFLAAQLEAAATLESVAQLFVYLEDKGMLCCRGGLCELSWMTDDQWLEALVSAQVGPPSCTLPVQQPV